MIEWFNTRGYPQYPQLFDRVDRDFQERTFCAFLLNKSKLLQ